MGAKTKTQTLSTQTPLQQALMAIMIKNIQGQFPTSLGGLWGGVGSNPTSTPATTTPFKSGLAVGPGVGGGVPNAGGGENPLAMILGDKAYGTRDQFTNPFVSPFRRNLGG